MIVQMKNVNLMAVLKEIHLFGSLMFTQNIMETHRTASGSFSREFNDKRLIKAKRQKVLAYLLLERTTLSLEVFSDDASEVNIIYGILTVKIALKGT